MFENPTFEQKEKPFDLENWLALEFKTQYETKAKILNRLGLLEILPEKQEIGILGIDGKEYPFPEMEVIEQEFRKNKELFETKMAQGFTELEITPFGMPLNRLIETLKQQLLKHSREGKLFHTKKNQTDSNETLKPFALDDENPLNVWDKYVGADENGELVYDAKEFSQNHQGKTKLQMIDSQESSPGFLITLREKNLNIPRECKGEMKNGRKQLETNKTPREYLQMILSQEMYQGELGQTPEEWLTEFLTHLEQTNQVIDDWQENGSASFQLGGYFHASDGVPYCVSVRDHRRAYLDGVDPGSRLGSVGVRSAVRVNGI